MPSILDDSEDFIADTPPLQLRKQKWREDNSNDDSKEPDVQSPVFVNETDESDIEDSPDSSNIKFSNHGNDSSIIEISDDDSLVLSKMQKNLGTKSKVRVHVISSESEENSSDD